MRSVNWEKIVTYLLWISIPLFVLCVLVPQGAAFTAIFRIRKVFYVSMTLLIVKGFFLLRKQESSRLLEILPFLALFLFSCYQFSRFPDYRFGVDDAYYYSYVSSVCIDKDLELFNQYERSGLVQFLDKRTLETKTPIGKTPNIFPVGPSVFWTPFFLIGYLVASFAGLPLDGFSHPFTFAVTVGNLFYVSAGLYFCYLFCSAFVSRPLSFFATSAVLLTTPYLYLFYRAYQMLSEPLSFALGALFLFLVWRSENRFSLLRWFLLGLLLGAITMVRFHNFVFAFVPAALLFAHARGDRGTSSSLRLLGIFSVGAFLGFLPQLIVWKLLNGSWFISMAGTFLPWWKSPFILETLFSSRKGLFPWDPVVVFSLCGLPFLLKKNRIWGIAMVAIIIITIWINSSQFDWWGATSLGSRRFLPIASIFVVGLAIFYSALPKVGKTFLIISVVCFTFLNLHFVTGFRYWGLQREHADRFSDILTGPYKPFQYVIYPLEFPVQFSYHWNYETPLYGPLTEFFIGEDVFYFQSRAQDQILSEVSPLFGKGWEVQNGQRKTVGSDAVLYVPMFMKEKPRFLIQLFLEPAGDENDIWIDFYWNGKFLRSRKAFADGRMIEVAIRSREYLSKMNELTLHIYHSRLGKETAPRLILQKINFVRDEREREY